MRLNLHKLIVFILLFSFLSPLAGNALGCNECEHKYSVSHVDAMAYGCGSNTETCTMDRILHPADGNHNHSCFYGTLLANDVFVKRCQRISVLNLPINTSRGFSSLDVARAFPLAGKITPDAGPTISQAILSHRTVVLLN
jgi:hypothetical protein